MKKIILTIFIATFAAFFGSSAFAEDNKPFDENGEINCDIDEDYEMRAKIYPTHMGENGDRVLGLFHSRTEKERLSLTFFENVCELKKDKKILCEWQNASLGPGKYHLEVDLNEIKNYYNSENKHVGYIMKAEFKSSASGKAFKKIKKFYCSQI